MKLFKHASILLAGAFIAASSLLAQMQQGKIQAFMVRGSVQLINDSTGESMLLARGQEFTEGHTVMTNNESSALLLFSNGSSINLSPNSSLNITQFLQEPYSMPSEDESFLALAEDPSASQTSLFLNYGEIVGEVKPLKSASSYNVATPAGTAGIRGTIFVCRYDPSTGAFDTDVIEGNVLVIFLNGSSFSVPGGQGVGQGGMRPLRPDLPDTNGDGVPGGPVDGGEPVPGAPTTTPPTFPSTAPSPVDTTVVSPA